MVESVVTYKDLSTLAGVPVFRSGHKEYFSTRNPNAFGHYNPAFVQWVAQTVVPGITDPGVRSIGQGIYDRYLALGVRSALSVYAKTRRDSTCFDSMVEKYEDAIRYSEWGQGRMYEEYGKFMHERYCESPESPGTYMSSARAPDGFVYVPHITSFWIRRRIDKTDEQFYGILRQLAGAYDPTALSLVSSR